MLVPVGIRHPYRRVPWVTGAIAGLCILLWAWDLPLGGRIREAWALQRSAAGLNRLISYQFLHANLLHLAGNMLFLAVYGRYVEERLGHLRFLGAYLLFGVVGGLAWLELGRERDSLPWQFRPESLVGASGSISGLMGFVLVGAPWVEVSVRFLWGPHVKDLGEMAAFWLLAPWILLQAMFGSLWGGGALAHVGGFAAGAALAAVLRSPWCRDTSWYLDPSLPGGGVEATRRLRHARGASADARRPAGPEAVLTSVANAPSRVAVIKVLMIRCGLEPDDAARRLDAVARGEPVALPFVHRADAERLADEVRALGVEVRVDPPAAGPGAGPPRDARSLPLPE